MKGRSDGPTLPFILLALGEYLTALPDEKRLAAARRSLENLVAKR